ncbi:hypothetical protein [Falsihalocynthiibacter arcticus]|uniref:hypothetical protein n=1 Tax=Falsihalocynthiibacter arcticus TaxID=1579316 RepID=UPI001F269D6A|nr:hypothetical protein [Falsihalocynthiibacter arcticus]
MSKSTALTEWAGRYRAPLYILKRILSAIPTLLAVLTVIFFAIRTLPGDPALAILGDTATDASIAALREKLGLNMPIWRQYLDFLGGYCMATSALRWCMVEASFPNYSACCRTHFR